MYLIDTMSEVQRLFVRTFKVHICRKSFNLTTIYHMLFFPGLSLFVMTHCKYQRELFLNLSSELHWVTKLIIREKWTSLNVEFFKLKMNVTQNSSNAGNVTGLSEEPVQLNSDDATWILTSAFIIFTMQSGFGLVESGLYSFFFTFQLKFPVFDNIPFVEFLQLDANQHIQYLSRGIKMWSDHAYDIWCTKKLKKTISKLNKWR